MPNPEPTRYSGRLTRMKQIRNLKSGDTVNLGDGARTVDYVFTVDSETTIHLLNGQRITLPSRIKLPTK